MSNKKQNDGSISHVQCPTPEHLTSENDTRRREDAREIYNVLHELEIVMEPSNSADSNNPTHTSLTIAQIKKDLVRSESKYEHRTTSPSYQGTHSRE